MNVEVSLLSGRRTTACTTLDNTVQMLQQQAQAALGVGKGRLSDRNGDVLDPFMPVKRLRVGEGDVLSLQISRTHAATVRPFAVVCGDGSVVTAGHGPSGGDSTAVQHRLRDVRSSQATEGSFAAILGDGSVLTWGDPESGGDSSEVMEQLTDVTAIQANMRAFAAIRRDGSVVTWGDVKFSADSGAVQEQLKGVHTRSQVYSGWTFAAIREDGSVVSWDGALMGSSCGADSSAVQHQLRDVRCLCATLEASAAILGDGSVVTWGDALNGGDCIVLCRTN